MSANSSRSTVVMTDQQAESITQSEELAYELRINEVMTGDVRAASPDMQMKDVVEIFRKTGISGMPVTDNGHLIGIISMEDIFHCLMEGDLDANTTQYMTPNPYTVKDVDLLIEALKVFVATGVGRLPVVDTEGKLAGIITKGDITRGLLKVLQSKTQEEEMRRYRASHLFEDIESDRTSLILRYNIKQHDFVRGGAASSNIKRALLRLGANPQIARRCSIAIYEAEINLIIHTNNGGIIRVEIEPHQITIDVTDDGPGIADVEQAMKPGYSTANEEIRELGFGAGMGLANIARCVDSMKLESVFGKGTRLKMKINLESKDTLGEQNPNSVEKR
jgi:anti-sigma regulatory factor (Ser/Thr protein kinase)/predicted transcriptional regulator